MEISRRSFSGGVNRVGAAMRRERLATVRTTSAMLKSCRGCKPPQLGERSAGSISNSRRGSARWILQLRQQEACPFKNCITSSGTPLALEPLGQEATAVHVGVFSTSATKRNAAQSRSELNRLEWRSWGLWISSEEQAEAGSQTGKCYQYGTGTCRNQAGSCFYGGVTLTVMTPSFQQSCEWTGSSD